MTQRPFLLAILDGLGHCDSTEGNAFRNSQPQHIEELAARYPSTLLQASGDAVGLMEGQIGNSEVGHLNIGAGRVVRQLQLTISQAIGTGNFFRNEALLRAIRSVREDASRLHLLGLLSDGGVHSHIDHLLALIQCVSQQDHPPTFLHLFTDGRDTPPKSALGYIEALNNVLPSHPFCRPATIGGRYYMMDRDQRWERTAQAYRAVVEGEGRRATSLAEAVQAAYEADETDEFITPTVLLDEGAIQSGDALICFNFRADRMRQIIRSLTKANFDRFERTTVPRLSHATSFALYDTRFDLDIAFEAESPANTLGEWLSSQRIPQFRITETEKYAHITFFFNGGREEPFPDEERILIPSPKVSTYDLVPQMSAKEITERLAKAMRENPQRFFLLNYANPDMVGHTGDYEAALQACKTVDVCVRTLLESIRAVNGTMILTSDHGNIETMYQPDGTPHTAHTTNPVPFILVDERFQEKTLRAGGKLGDIAPTILDLLDIAKPSEMTGRSLLQM